MQYRKYGKNGPEVSVLGFGVMRLPLRGEKNYLANLSKSVPLLRTAMEAGLNFFDSHHFYHDGNSEDAIGRALKGWKGRKIYIQTKTPFYQEKPIDYFKKLLCEALEKLGVDCIDYLLFHSMDMKMFKNRHRQFIKFTDWAINRGYIKHRGFSSHDKVENIKQFIDTGEFAAMLVSYNWMNPYVEDTIAYAADKGMGVSLMNPIGGGSLAVDVPSIRRLLPGVKTSTEFALRYVLSTPKVTLALSGMSTVEQLKENIEIAGRKTFLTVKQRQTLLARLEGFRKKAKLLCSHCAYCMPCPHHVDIPFNLLLLKKAILFGLTENSRADFKAIQGFKDGDHSALGCKRCGECLPKCPNKIDIITQLQKTALLLK